MSPLAKRHREFAAALLFGVTFLLGSVSNALQPLSVEVLHDFDGGSGSNPGAALTLGRDGELYGSTPKASSNGPGTLFKIDTNGTFTLLHRFNGSDGAKPAAALALGSDGALYGSTISGGSDDSGTLFKIDESGAFTSLHSFEFGDGAYPTEALALGSDGALYGSTPNGGSFGYGTLFKIDASGTFTSLHSFDSSDGDDPRAALALGSDGALYGSTSFGGGGSDAGTLFKIDTNGTFRLLHTFHSDDGEDPEAPLTLGSDGALYGSTSRGGQQDAGTLFKIDVSGTFTLLHSFESNYHPCFGCNPVRRYLSAALALGVDGALYGSTPLDGSFEDGTLFKIDANGTFTSLHSFDGSDGGSPQVTLTLGYDGALYGSTAVGGSYGDGTLFMIDVNGTFTSMHSFDRSSDGSIPNVALALGSDSALYGTTQFGGSEDDGVVFRLGVAPFEFGGFYNPVDNLPTLNRVKAGSTVPIQFSLGETQGPNIFAPRSPASAAIPCDSTLPIGAIEETLTARPNRLSYDASGRYAYLWKTDEVWAGTCRQLVVRLIDGSIHRANFKLTRGRIHRPR